MKLYFDEFEFDLERCELRRAAEPIKVDPLVLRLLGVLLRNAGELVSKQQLITQVWDGRAVSENVITVAMVRLRKTLGHKPGEREFVNNVHGRGYRFVCPVAQQPREPQPAWGARTPQRSSRPPFVGRERLLRTLHDAYTEAAAGRGSACLLTGEPGIGKTRAIEVFEAQTHANGGSVVWGHCRESGDTPSLWPFAQILREVLAWEGALDSRAELRSWITRVPELGLLLPELARELDAPPASSLKFMHGWSALSKHQVFDAITTLLERAAEHTTCVVVLDDLQRADVASLELLQFWIDRLPRTHILLLGSLNRVDLAPAAARAHFAYVYGHRNTTRLTLQRLSEAEVASYVAALIDDPSGEFARAVYRKSEGNPFFMSELARQLIDSDSAAPSDLAVPDAALELVRRRLSILDEAARGALSYAAVIGRRFELPVLQAVSGQDARALMNSLDGALGHNVLSRVPDSRTSFTFAHDMLRVALYEALPPSELRFHHLQVARALEDRRLSGVAVPCADLAFHFHAALPDSDLRKTVQYCGEAATESSKLFAYADAQRYLRHARQALELIEHPSPKMRLRLILNEALCARICADPDYESLAREAVTLARDSGRGSVMARAAFLLDINTGLPALRGSREAFEDALAHVADDDEATRAALMAKLATVAPLAYDAGRSREQVRHAVELALHSDLPVTVHTALSAELYLCSGEHDQRRASEVVAALEQLYRQHPMALSVPPLLLELHRAIRALQLGDPAGFDAGLERSEVVCRRLRDRGLGWHVERARAMQRINAGDEQAGVRELQALHRRAAQDALAGTLLFRAYDQCVISADAASLSRAELRAALAPDSADPPSVWSIKLRALARAGLHDEARAQLRAVTPAALLELPRDRDYLGTLGALVHCVLELRAYDYAPPLWQLLSEYPDGFSLHATFLCEGSVAQLRGELAQSLGRSDEAAQLLTRGAKLAEGAGLMRAATISRNVLAESS
ncbi:MAG TPA: AAA family ATPase [Polyangiales bacterium]|nr:AAA family ATPase [Polyangiales bacterium]